MSVRQSPAYRLLLLAVSVAALAGIGYYLYRAAGGVGTAADNLAQARAAYARGVEQLAPAPAAAAATFDETNALADRAFDRLDAEERGGKLSVPAGDIRKTIAEIRYLQARAIRDAAFARASAAGQPIPTSTDTSTGQTFRNFAAVPDPAARQACVSALLTAVKADPDNAEVASDALRLRLSQAEIPWAEVAPLARAVVRADPKDARAQFTLARYEFEQPENNSPTADERKDRNRVSAAREHLKRATDAGAPPWRAAGLEVRILRWLTADAARRNQPGEGFARAVRDRLFAPADGLLARAARGERLTGLSVFDADGLIAMHTAAVEVAAEDRDPVKTRAAVEAFLGTANRLADGDGKPFLPAVAAAVVTTANAAQPALGANWPAVKAAVQAFLDKHPEAAAQPGLTLALAEAALRDAAGGGPWAEAVRLAEAGLTAAGPKADGFHAVLAEAKFFDARPAAELEPHLIALRASSDPVARATGQLIDGAAAARAGRLTAARRLLEPLTAEGRETPGVAVRAAASVAGVCLRAGDPMAAVNVLKLLDDRLPGVSAADRAWVAAEFPTADDRAAAQVLALLGAGLQRAALAARQNPGRPLPLDLIAPYERAADALRKGLRAPTPADRVARLAHARFLASTGRRDEAMREFTALTADYPASPEVVRAEAPFLVAPVDPESAANPYPAADARVRRFVDKFDTHPRVGPSARRLWAEWLAGTGRADAAAAHLAGLAADDPTAVVLLTIARPAPPPPAEAKPMLDLLPADGLLTAALVQGAGEPGTGLDRFESDGPARLYAAAAHLAADRTAEAVRGFAAAVEFPNAATTARAGLRRALLTAVAADPVGGRALAIEIAADHPDEPTGYLAAAVAAVRAGDIGEPGEVWEPSHSLYAAVARWEPAAVRAGVDRPLAQLVRASVRLAAGDATAARTEAARAAAASPDHAPTRLFLAGLLLTGPDADPAAARPHVRAAFAADPDHPELPWAEARLKEAARDFPGATADYERQLKLDPKQARAHARLVAVADAQADPAAALAAASRWNTDCPDDADAAAELVVRLTAAGAGADAKPVGDALAARIVSAPPAERAAKLARLADGFLHAGRTAEGVAFARQAVLAAEVEPAVLTHARAAAATRQWDVALATYRGVLAKNPRHLDAAAAAARLLAIDGDRPADALDVLKPLLARPDRLPADVLDTAGQAFRRLNRPDRLDEMKAVFEAAARRYPSDPRMHLYLGEALAGLKETDRAAAALDTAVRLANRAGGLSAERKKELLEQAAAARKRLKG